MRVAAGSCRVEGVWVMRDWGERVLDPGLWAPSFGLCMAFDPLEAQRRCCAFSMCGSSKLERRSG